VAPQLIERPRQIVLVGEPAFVFCNDRGAVAVDPDLEQVSAQLPALSFEGHFVSVILVGKMR
jgi:hypothetical protein